jgi:hypothetical protein
VARWLLLCALAFGVVGMHHLGMASHPPHDGPMSPTMTLGPAAAASAVSAQAMSTSAVMAAVVVADPDCCDHTDRDGHGAPGRGHEGWLHLCLAVLAAATVLIAVLTRRRRLCRDRWPRARLPQISRRWPPRAPPDTATVLASLGVLRL